MPGGDKGTTRPEQQPNGATTTSRTEQNLNRLLVMLKALLSRPRHVTFQPTLDGRIISEKTFELTNELIKIKEAIVSAGRSGRVYYYEALRQSFIRLLFLVERKGALHHTLTACSGQIHILKRNCQFYGEVGDGRVVF